MRKYLFLAILLLVIENATAQNQGTNLYIVLTLNEPVMVKNVYKHHHLPARKTRMIECRMSKSIFSSNSYRYFVGYPLYYGKDLSLAPKQGASIQTVNISQIVTLYPTARSAEQLYNDMQPAVDYDYTHQIDWFSAVSQPTPHTVEYLQSFDKIFVIEHLPNGTAKVVECKITTTF